MEKEQLMRELDRAKQRTDELEANLALKTQSERLKEEAAQEAERMLKSLEVETAQRGEELQATKESLNMLKSRSAALEKIGEETDAEIVSLLRRAQEAESWQATIREGFAKVMEVHSDEPFEQTWQKLEDILQCSVVHSTTNDAFCTNGNAQDTSNTCANNDGDNPAERSESKAEDSFATELNKELCQTGESAQAGANLSTDICSPSKPLKHGDCVDSLPKFTVGHRHIVPFSSVHDRLSREDSLSLFNDPAELEMLMMSTPDLQGALISKPKVSGNAFKEAQKLEKLPEKDNEEVKKSDAVLTNQPAGAESTTGGRSKSALVKVHDPFDDESAKTEQSNTKRKVVSFEGTRVFTQTEVGRTRRMSDATDNHSEKEYESNGIKRTQKRTYSRLRQSVAQEEASIESNINVESANQNLAGNPQKASIKMTDDSTENPKPPKRARNSADGPERRLSPKGLALGSSRSNAASQAANARSRAKRRTRGEIQTSIHDILG